MLFFKIDFQQAPPITCTKISEEASMSLHMCLLTPMMQPMSPPARDTLTCVPVRATARLHQQCVPTWPTHTCLHFGSATFACAGALPPACLLRATKRPSSASHAKPTNNDFFSNWQGPTFDTEHSPCPDAFAYIESPPHHNPPGSATPKVSSVPFHI